MDLGKVIRELDVEPDEELVPAPNEAPDVEFRPPVTCKVYG
jgi:hypothetical protein